MLTIKGKSINTVNEYSSDLNIFFKFMKIHFASTDIKTDNIDDVDISDLKINFLERIKLQDIYEYLLYMGSERHNSASTRARKVACLRSYFKYMCSKANYINVNPCLNLDSPKVKQSLPRYLTVEESKTLLSVVDGENKARDYAIITLFLNCGLRLSELVGINIPDIKDSTITVTGKGNKERLLYLNKACVKAINNYMKVRPVDGVVDKNALFLSGRLKRISPKTVQHIVKVYIEKAGLDPSKYSVHKLRHTAATNMYKYGHTDLRTLQEILGHEQLATTQIYTHISDKDKEDAAKNNPLANL